MIRAILNVLAVALTMVVLPLGAAERSLDKEVVVNATLDQAWEAWTTREGVVSFFRPCLGHRLVEPAKALRPRAAGLDGLA